MAQIRALPASLRHALEVVRDKLQTRPAPGSVHDYMHAKSIVVDETVFTGSYNFSHSGEENAENMLVLPSAAVADACTRYVSRLIDKYGQSTAPVP